MHELLALALLVALVAVPLMGLGWSRAWRRYRLELAKDHQARSFLRREPPCRCDACQAWRRIWGQG